MQTLSWNEIQSRAVVFSSKWDGETYEKGESQSFWSDFLNVYGVDRKRIGAIFEYAIKKVDNKQGFIDMFWPGMLLAEQKSGGRDLSKAGTQAFDYLPNISDAELPKMIVVCDFNNFECFDTIKNTWSKFTLEQFPKHIKEFGFLNQLENETLAEEDPVNRKAAEAMAALHNELRDANFIEHELELLLVRLVFCLFANDSGIFEPNIFDKFLANRTKVDGTDTGPLLGKIFETLNTPEDKRQTSLDEDIAAFPYINGGLFSETTRMPDFTSAMRDKLLSSTNLDWSSVSPAIFGSMFQGVMDEKTRRNLGAHYTSEKNIFKVIDSLFLDELKDEFEKAKNAKRNRAELLEKFHDKLANLKFLDPACGCGNFLVITYRELRRLEHKVLEAIHGSQGLLTDLEDNIKVNVDQMHGIEIEEFPSLIAETALWLTDHQMNMEASKQFGQHFVRLPLTKRANVVNANALRIDWATVIEPKDINYIMGNPPFNGSKMMTSQMRQDLENQFAKTKGIGILDFVCAWYAIATKLMSFNNEIQCAFVSTNSISQGEQVGVLWKSLINQNITINFAHQTFKWNNDAKGVATVFCVIVSFGMKSKDKYLYTYQNESDQLPIRTKCKNINGYLVDGPDVYIDRRSKPLSDAPAMCFGNMPLDGGNLLFTLEEYEMFIKQSPETKELFKPIIGAHEFLNNIKRYCLWLLNVTPQKLRSEPKVIERINLVKEFRAQSVRQQTKEKAATPSLFGEIRQPNETYILVPRHSSENREYIPLGFFDNNTIAADSCLIIPNATKYHFGILSSLIHMAWVKYTCGRIKSDYRYSKDIVYNNFPWPQNVSEDQKIIVENLTEAVLHARTEFPDSSLADLYDPRTMPLTLLNAHQNLDKYVDSLYQTNPFKDDIDRISYLFMLYKSYS